MPNTFYVYIITNKKRGVLYVGCTSDLEKRIYEHKNNLMSGFSSRYNLHKLVYLESKDDPLAMIHREKQLKRYRRDWKFNLIEKDNPEWEDLDPGMNPG
jgi:putative endonuclease